MRDLFLEVGLEWGAALRRSKGIPLFDPFKRAMRKCMTQVVNQTFLQLERESLQIVQRR